METNVNDDLYIGWMQKAPKSNVHFLRRYIVVVLIAIAIIGSLLALSQNKFGTGTFEYGTLTEVKGIYLQQPVPMLKVIAGKDILGNLSYITIPLVGYGKHGAEGVIATLETANNVSLNQREVTFKGTLLYNDGKTILQVDEHDQPLIQFSKRLASSGLLPVVRELGIQNIKGEIIDPKCYFGVMKPSEGKPHRDCAIRCILGGIPPMLAAKNVHGEANYYLLVGANGEKFNTQVQDFVAEPVAIEGRAVQYDDWVVIYVSGKQPIKRISGLSLVRNEADVLACTSMKDCK
jgi:hypothetical protein